MVKSSDSSRGPKFNSQQPDGSSQPFVMGSDALSCRVSEENNSALTYNQSIHQLKKKRRKENQVTVVDQKEKNNYF